MDDPNEPYVLNFPLPVFALGPTRGSYRYSPKLLPWLTTRAAAYDAIVVNGLWTYSGFGTWRALQNTTIPYYVYTHGMLDPWFKRRYPIKHIKKWMYWPWGEYRVLRDARAVLFTSEEERLQARQSFWLYRAREKLTLFGTAAPPPDREMLRKKFFVTHPRLEGRRLLLFLGRIHEKKGCDLLIRAFARLNNVESDLHLVFAGPDKTGWVAKLNNIAEELGISNRITWTGMLSGSDKWGAFYASEAFVLPSHQENFGVAVAEALSCGLPVLITNKVNIWREVEAAGAGIICSDSIDGVEASLRQWLSLKKEEREKIALSALAAYRGRFSIDAMASSLLEVLTE
jgi:glycosyltransferase involved in cell wall biosynthesis